MNNVLLVDRIDGKNRMVLRPVEPPALGPKEVLYRVHAIGMNRADLLYLEGNHYTATILPSRVGYEACGIVTAVGDEVTEYRAGDRVCALPFGDPLYSTAGEYAITPANYLVGWPRDFTAAEAAASWMQYLTSYMPLKEVADISEKDVVLITAASSSAGLGGLQLARHLGATVVATTRTIAKRDALLNAGAHHVVVTGQGDVAQEILDATGGRGVTVAYDPIAGRSIFDYAQALAKNARIFVYGVLSSPEFSAPIVDLVRIGAHIHIHSLINYMPNLEIVARAKSYLLSAMESGELRPIIDKIYPFEDFEEAYDYMRSGNQFGKLVLETRFVER